MYCAFLRNTQSLMRLSSASTSVRTSAVNCRCGHTELSKSVPVTTINLEHEVDQSVEESRKSDLDYILTKLCGRKSADEVFHCLKHYQAYLQIGISHDLVWKLLCRFKDDWKRGLGVFRWAGSCQGYSYSLEVCDTIIDILGKAKKWDEMESVLEELSRDKLVTLNTVAKVMRRFAGAGVWENSVRTFDNLEKLGLVKDVESMNLLVDALCKEKRVEQARSIFLELKCHIPPNAHTFNIFIHGWCKVDRIEEAHWTIEEMKGHGFPPCVISYSTIVRFYCQKCEFDKAYKVLEEMEAKGCPPNSATYTIIMSSLTKSGKFEEALAIAERMKNSGCKLDTLFYNCVIHTLGKAGRLKEALYAFEVEMPEMDIPANTSTYNSVITMFCRHGQEQKAYEVLHGMDSKYIAPDCQTYHPLFKSCIRRGNLDELRNLLDDMVKKHNLSIDLSAYTLLIHGLCRLNRLEWAYSFFQEMVGQDITPRYSTCRLLLDEAKQKHMQDITDKVKQFMTKS